MSAYTPRRERRRGRCLSWVAVAASFCLSVAGAYTFGLPYGWEVIVGLCVCAALAEPFKISLNETIWETTGFFARPGAALAYGFCAFVSATLIHVFIAQSINDRLGVEHRYASLLEKVEQQNLKIIPGVSRTAAEIADQLTKSVKEGGPNGPLSKSKLEKDRDDAVANERVQATIKRLNKERSEMLEKHGEALKERSRSDSAQERSDVQNNVNKVSWLLALMLELVICGGVWTDFRYNYKHHRDKATTLPMSLQTTIVQAEQTAPQQANKVRTDTEGAFDTWLRGYWETQRGTDGWLTCTQRDLADAGGVSSSGTVNANLKRLSSLGVIDLVTTPRKTRIRFRARLELVKSA